jgi:hypothetical protein
MAANQRTIPVTTDKMYAVISGLRMGNPNVQFEGRRVSKRSLLAERPSRSDCWALLLIEARGLINEGAFKGFWDIAINNCDFTP